mgnify:CR=1 FL=1
MKTMKFFMLASAFASMIGFSSCLNGGDYTNSYSDVDFVKVTGFLGTVSLKNQLDMNMFLLIKRLLLIWNQENMHILLIRMILQPSIILLR